VHIAPFFILRILGNARISLIDRECLLWMMLLTLYVMLIGTGFYLQKAMHPKIFIRQLALFYDNV